MNHAAGDRLLSSPNRTEKTISSLDSLLHLIFQTQNHIRLHSFYSLISFKIAGILTWLLGNPSLKTMCNAYINNPMHTSNASRYFTKITRGKITHTFATCKSPTIFCEAFFIIITVILKFLLSPKSTAFARKTLSFCVCWLLMEKHFTSVGWRSVCFQAKKPFLLLKHHLFHLLQSLTVTFLAVGQPYQALLLS